MLPTSILLAITAGIAGLGIVGYAINKKDVIKAVHDFTLLPSDVKKDAGDIMSKPRQELVTQNMKEQYDGRASQGGPLYNASENEESGNTDISEQPAQEKDSERLSRISMGGRNKSIKKNTSNKRTKKKKNKIQKRTTNKRRTKHRK